MDPRSFLSEYLGESYAELLPQWHDRLSFLGIKAGLDESEANDLASTAMARALECLDRFDPNKAGSHRSEGFRRWLQGIHQNVLRDHLDHLKRRRNPEYASWGGGASAGEPEAAAVTDTDGIDALLDSLPNERMRQVAKLLAGGKRKSEIAKELGVSKARITQLANEMRQHLGPFIGTKYA